MTERLDGWQATPRNSDPTVAAATATQRGEGRPPGAQNKVKSGAGPKAGDLDDEVPW
jgi:hypothetical protein